MAAAGIVPAEEPEKSRKLIIGTNHEQHPSGDCARDRMLPTYVQYGAADFGIAGKDVLIEHGGDGLYQPLDLHIASCRMMVAVKKGFDYAAASKPGSRLRIATKYPDIAAEHFADKGVHVDIIKLYGSIGACAFGRFERRDCRFGFQRQYIESQWFGSCGTCG